MRFGGVHDGEVAERRDGAADAGHVARKAREPERRDVGSLQSGLPEERHLPVDVAPRAVHADDGVAAVGLPDVLDARLDLVVGLVPRDALPLVLAALARTAQGVLHAVGMVHRLVERQALDAQLAVRARIQRVAFHALDPAVLRVDEDAARRMASRRRVMVRTRDGVAVLLPLPLPLVVRLAVDAVKELLVVSHGISPVSRLAALQRLGRRPWYEPHHPPALHQPHAIAQPGAELCRAVRQPGGMTEPPDPVSLRCLAIHQAICFLKRWWSQACRRFPRNPRPSPPTASGGFSSSAKRRSPPKPRTRQ